MIPIARIFPPVANATERLPFFISSQSLYFVTNSKTAKKTTIATTAKTKYAALKT